jgi:hypothetical protein
MTGILTKKFMKKEQKQVEQKQVEGKSEEQRLTEKFIFELNQLQELYNRTLYAVNVVNEKGEIGPIIKIMIK